MARQGEMDNASAAGRGQSKHPDPPDTQSDVSATAPHQNRHKAPQHQKQHHVGGRPYNRVPSAKVLHTKSHQHSQAAPRLTRRTTSPGERESQRRPAYDRRVNSEVKLSRDNSSPNLPKPANLPKSASQSSLKRNRFSAEFAKRNRSADKLQQRNASGSTVNKHKPTKSQVTFDIGIDDPEDEWVDASGSNSPHVSRKGSLISSGQSSLQRVAASNGNTRPQTPQQPTHSSTAATPSSSEKERVRHKEYLTSRVLRRTMSQGATTQMTSQMAQADLPRQSPEPDGINGSLSTSGNQNSLTSRFVEIPGSGIASDSSLYNALNSSRQLSATVSPRVYTSSSTILQDGAKPVAFDVNNSALVPQATAGRSLAPPAETSRIQQKLNLQRQSSALEPGQAVGVVGGATGPLIGIGGAGFDGASSRDPRVHRLMERTGMEYLVVRRYQNPIARSLNRLGRMAEVERSKRIPQPLAREKRVAAADVQPRHARNVSMPFSGQVVSSRRNRTIRTDGAASSFEADEGARMAAGGERLSGSSAVYDEVDDTATLLRNIWERPLDLSAGTD